MSNPALDRLHNNVCLKRCMVFADVGEIDTKCLPMNQLGIISFVSNKHP